jgi:hypothetical protein
VDYGRPGSDRAVTIIWPDVIALIVWTAILFARFEFGAHSVVPVQGRRIVLEQGLGMQMNGWHVVDVDHETKPVR